jgi:DNA-binding response OmpR family regulator
MASPPARILVVDDNEALRENLAEALELEGYEVSVAEDGARAQTRLAQDPLPQVVLLDLMLPGMDGKETLRRIREDARLAAVRVVMTTGHSGARVKNGADGVLMKPFGVRELLAALRKLGV